MPAPFDHETEAMTAEIKTALTIDSYRRAEGNPGGPMRPAWIHVGTGRDGTGVSVLVDDWDIEAASAVADAIVEVLPNATAAIAHAKRMQAHAEERARRSRAAEMNAKDRLHDVLHGRRRLFGEALVRVAKDGSVWLLDPVKQEAGFGLRFPSLPDLWRAHPELRPCGGTAVT